MWDYTPRVTDGTAINDSINESINSALEKENASQPTRKYLGGSRAGLKCIKQLAYEYHSQMAGVSQTFEGKILRRFALGHQQEDTTAEWLRKAGFDILTHKEDGGQFGFEQFVDGNKLSGHFDGIITGGTMSLHYPFLWEHKIMKDSSWQAFKKRGLQAVNDTYYGQVQLYMAYASTVEGWNAEIKQTMFMAFNTDTSEIHTEIVKLDLEYAQWVSDRAVNVLRSKSPTEFSRISKSPDYYGCRFCPFKAECFSLPPSE